MPPRFLFRLAVPATLALALGGCINLGGGKTPPSLINLTAEKQAPVGAVVIGRQDNTLVVLDPETDRRLAVQRVAVTVDPANVAYLKDAMWVERPARLFRALLAETIRAKGTRLVFEESDLMASGSTRLSGRLIDIGYDGSARAVVVRYDAVLSAANGVTSTRRFEARVDNVDPKAKTVGPALNQAANDVARQVADWVG